MMSSIQCWKKFCYHNMNASLWEILIFETFGHCRDQLLRPATNWCNYLQIITSNNMCMKPPAEQYTGPSHIYKRRLLIVNLKITDKIIDHCHGGIAIGVSSQSLYVDKRVPHAAREWSTMLSILGFLVPWLRWSTFSMYDDILNSN